MEAAFATERHDRSADRIMGSSTVEEALRQFREAAIEKGDGVTPAARDHALHRRMKAALQNLRAAGDIGKAAFGALLKDESTHVRCWAAAELLSQGNEAAQAVLKEIATRPGITAFSARMTLEEYAAGRLRSPFA